jgi:orotate phosphoribosyltransferase
MRCRLNFGLLIALVTLGFTALGSIAAIIGTRQSRSPHRRRPRHLDKGLASRLLRGRADNPDEADKVLDIISQFIYVSGTGRTAFGTLDKMESSVFLDLLSACTVLRNRIDIARSITENVEKLFGRERPTIVAVAKEGNVLLAGEVARQLDLGIIVVRTKLTAIRFGNPIEGLLPHGAYVIAVDDVAADGEMLVRLAQRIRRYGGRIEHAICEVERLDGNARERLMTCDIELFAPIRFDETTLRELRQLPGSTTQHR